MKTNFYVFIILYSFVFVNSSCDAGGMPVNGIKTVHFPNSDDIEQTVEYKNGKKNGYLKEYYRDGTLKARQFYVNDTLDDSTIFFHKNGQLKFIQVFKNKLRSGCWRQYNKDGVMYSEMFFKDDLLDSTSSSYSFRTHRLLSRVHYRVGAKQGADEQFYANGNVKSREIYDKGKINMGTREWTENGTEINNDFKITVTEKDKLMLENKLSYIIELQNPDPEDEVFQVFNFEPPDKFGALSRLEKEGDTFIFELSIAKGGFIMENITIAAYKKTKFGNTVVKTKNFRAASNNF